MGLMVNDSTFIVSRPGTVFLQLSDTVQSCHQMYGDDVAADEKCAVVTQIVFMVTADAFTSSSLFDASFFFQDRVSL